MSTYTIVFSRTSEPGRFSLKATATNQRSRQLVGFATVVSPRKIEVATANGMLVGTAPSRAAAAIMIDAHHREHNAEEYWMWTKSQLLVRGKAVTA